MFGPIRLTPSRAPILGLALAALFAGGATPGAAQQPTPAAPAAATAPAPDPELVTFAKAFVAVGLVRDDYNAQLALPKNKTLELQAQIRKEMKEKVEAAIRATGLTPDGYHRIEYTVTIDPARRVAFDKLLVELAKGG